MSKARSIIRKCFRGGLLLACVYVLLSLAWRADLIPPMPPAPFQDHDPLTSLVHLLYRSLGPGDTLASSVFGTHVWYNQAANQGTNLAPGAVVFTPVTLPSTPDHLPVCFEFNFAYMIDTSSTTDAYGGPEAGTTHSIDGGCPLWPYNNIAGHAFGSGFNDVFHLGTLIPHNGNSVEAMDFRQDGMYFNNVGACGGPIAINSATFNNGTITLNLAANPETGFAVGGWSSTGNGEYAQVEGSSVAALNSVPGQIYTITGRSTTSLSFAGTSAQACASGCGNVYQPYLAGQPPITLPVGIDGGTPEPEFGVINASNSGANINWSETINILCFPLMSCPNPNAAGCGIGNTMQ